MEFTRISFLVRKQIFIQDFNDLILVRAYENFHKGALGVQIGSEKQMRKISQEVIGDNLTGEEASFYFSTRHGMDIQPAPHVYIPDLVAKVFDVLEQNKRSTCNCLLLLH